MFNTTTPKNSTPSATNGSTNGHHKDDDSTTVDTEAETDIFESDGSEELVWYFSYGSNMNPEVFEKKRKIKCRDHKLCKVPGYVLTYTESCLPYLEPAFCTCVPRSFLQDDDDNRPDIHGVAFLITKQQYEHMLLTEGGWGYQEYRYHPLYSIGHYGEEEIECVEIEPESTTGEEKKETSTSEQIPKKTFKALTLVGMLGNNRRYDAHASKRYYDLVNAGAESSGLPRSYREYLKEKHPAFEPTGCWKADLARRIFFFIAFPSFFFEFGCLNLAIRWQERKLKRKQQLQQQNDESSSSTTDTTELRPKSRKRFEDVLRPPWIICKMCYFYRTIVLDRILVTILFEWCKLPNGFRNCCENAATKEATDAASTKSN